MKVVGVAPWAPPSSARSDTRSDRREESGKNIVIIVCLKPGEILGVLSPTTQQQHHDMMYVT